jgi:hypothetical protein
MASVNEPGWPEVPIRTVGCTLRTMSASDVSGDLVERPVRHLADAARA